MSRYCFLPLSFILFCLQTIGQTNSFDKKKFFTSDTVEVSRNEVFYVKSPSVFTSVVLSVDSNSSINNSLIEVADKTIQITIDEHFISKNSTKHSNLISFETPQEGFLFRSRGLVGTVVFYFINSGQSPLIDIENQKSLEILGCDEPPSIDQDVWRDGLPEPNYSRIFTETKHLIIHHSAGSNTNSNYTQVVRDIYIYHTQVNGWSDIGYNYLIAQNGQIYKGRDPLEGAQDKVQGAHFCGKNSNTMGICILGNYTSLSPTANSLNSLIELLSWKSYKDDLDPLGIMTSSGIIDLNVIAGHRDGCSTECPGTITYSKLDSLRQVVDEVVKACNGQTSGTSLAFYGFPLKIKEGEYVSFVNNSTGSINNWKWLFEGGIPSTSLNENPGQVRYLINGNYNVSLVGWNQSGGYRDTLLFEDYIQVTENFDPIISPNPLLRPYIGHIKNINLELPLRIKIYDQLGRLINDFLTESNNDELDFQSLSPGIYLLSIKGLNQTKALRLVVI